jgi:methionine synthase I (cobalamin-dependent)
MATLKERLDAGDAVILDGAIGTELQRMGVSMHNVAWAAQALYNHPATVRQLHEDYIRAGVDVITANTFSSARYVLEPAGMGEMTRDLNTRAITLAKQARENVEEERDVYVAGVLSRFRLPRVFTDAQIRAAYDEQAEIQASAGADLMLLEFLGDQVEAVALAVEAATATGLPTWVAMEASLGEDGSTVFMGGRGYPSSPLRARREILFADAVYEVMAKGGEALLVMHSSMDDTGPALRVARERWAGALGAYAQSGDWLSPNWQFVNMISPEDYQAQVVRWRQEHRLQIAGGCCGIGLQHIELLRPGLES